MAVREGSSITTGYLIISTLSVVVFTLFLKEPMMLVFGIPLVLIFTLSASAGKGDPDSDLEAVGFTERGIETAIPFGVIGGLATLFLGSIITKFTPQTASMLVPDFTAIASILTPASVIPPALATAVTIISTWLIVAPSEEAMCRVLFPFGFMKVFQSEIIAFGLSALVFAGLHIPTFIQQHANIRMYAVIILLATVTTILYIVTKSLISAIVCHGIFNSGVLLASQNIDTTSLYVFVVIAGLLAYGWFSGVGRATR